MKDNKQLNWYYEKDGRQIGPVSEDGIENQVKTGILSYGSKVWQEGAAGWVSLEDSRFKHLLTYPPPLNTVLKKRFVYYHIRIIYRWVGDSQFLCRIYRKRSHAIIDCPISGVAFLSFTFYCWRLGISRNMHCYSRCERKQVFLMKNNRN